jgi:predicted DNA-binding transcriptional regulator AlpA
MSDSPPAPEPLAVGAREAARLLGVALSTFWRWDSSGELGPRGVKKCGRRLWALSELRAWVAAGMPRRSEWQALRDGSVRRLA